LKQGMATGGLARPGRIPRPRAGASLKRLWFTALARPKPLYPPPAGGGLIEALLPPHLKSVGLSYPPPAGGGLIEAMGIGATTAGVVRVSPARGRGPH